MSAWNHWWFGRYGLEQVLLDDFLKKEGGGGGKKRKKQLSQNVNAPLLEMVRVAGQRISLHFPFLCIYGMSLSPSV